MQPAAQKHQSDPYKDKSLGSERPKPLKPGRWTYGEIGCIGFGSALILSAVALSILGTIKYDPVVFIPGTIVILLGGAIIGGGLMNHYDLPKTNEEREWERKQRTEQFLNWVESSTS